jgi:hypothetical protein
LKPLEFALTAWRVLFEMSEVSVESSHQFTFAMTVRRGGVIPDQETFGNFAHSGDITEDLRNSAVSDGGVDDRPCGYLRRYPY